MEKWEERGAERYKLRLNSLVEIDSLGKVNVLGDDSIGHCEKKNHTNIFVILNAYRQRERERERERELFESTNKRAL